MANQQLPFDQRELLRQLDQARVTRRAEIRSALHRHYRRTQARNPIEERAFSITKVLRAMAEEKPIDGFEAEIMQMADADRGGGYQYWSTKCLPYALFEPAVADTPSQVSTRDLTVGTANAGGYLVGTTKPRGLTAFDGSVSARLGVVIDPGWVHSLAIPRVTGTLPVTWLTNEGSTGTEQTPTLDMETASPKTACALVDVSHKLLRQGVSMDAFMVALLLQGARSAIDVAVFAGSGASGQPTGLLLNSDIQSVTGTAFDNGSAASCKKKVADGVVDDFPTKWVASTDVRELLEKRQRFGTSSVALWDADQMLGRPALSSNRMPAGTLLYGDFSQVIVPIWGAGIEIAVDPYSQFATGVVTFRVMVTCDVLAPQPGALVRSGTIT